MTAIQEAARIVRDEYGWGASVFFTCIFFIGPIKGDEIGVVKDNPFLEPEDFEDVKW